MYKLISRTIRIFREKRDRSLLEEGMKLWKKMMEIKKKTGQSRIIVFSFISYDGYFDHSFIFIDIYIFFLLRTNVSVIFLRGNRFIRLYKHVHRDSSVHYIVIQFMDRSFAWMGRCRFEFTFCSELWCIAGKGATGEEEVRAGDVMGADRESCTRAQKKLSTILRFYRNSRSRNTKVKCEWRFVVFRYNCFIRILDCPEEIVLFHTQSINLPTDPRFVPPLHHPQKVCAATPNLGTEPFRKSMKTPLGRYGLKKYSGDRYERIHC